jgi:hypothetical protein
VAIRNVISTLHDDGTEVMGPGILMYHYPHNDILTGSVLTVENNHFCVQAALYRDRVRFSQPQSPGSRRRSRRPRPAGA